MQTTIDHDYTRRPSAVSTPSTMVFPEYLTGNHSLYYLCFLTDKPTTLKSPWTWPFTGPHTDLQKLMVTWARRCGPVIFLIWPRISYCRIQQENKNTYEIQSLLVDYLSGGRDLIHRLLFPEVPLARYVSWPQILMKSKQKTIHTWAFVFSGHIYINHHVCCLFEWMFYLIHVI